MAKGAKDFFFFFWALKAKDDEEEESSEDENSKFKDYIPRKFKKFIKNANVKMNDKGRKKSRFPHKKTQDRFKGKIRKVYKVIILHLVPKASAVKALVT